MDIPYGASYIARQAYKLAGEEVPMPWKQIFEERMDSCHFEYPGSTHAIRMKVCNMDDGGSFSQREGTLLNTIETAFSGSRSLKCVIKPVARGEKVMVYKKTYCRPADFHDSRYDPAFSPLIYPGQTLHAAVRVTGEEYGVKACLEGNYAGMLGGLKLDDSRAGWGAAGRSRSLFPHRNGRGGRRFLLLSGRSVLGWYAVLWD